MILSTEIDKLERSPGIVDVPSSLFEVGPSTNERLSVFLDTNDWKRQRMQRSVRLPWTSLRRSASVQIWPSRLSAGEVGQVCTGGPAHLRCCLGSCSEELKMDLGLVLDASGRIGALDDQKQVPFVEDLLARVNLALNKTHVAMIKFSTGFDP